MSTEQRDLIVGGLRVEVRRKDNKHLHLGVYPPHGRIRVSAPLRTKDDTIRLAVVTRMPWIRRRQKALREQPRQTERELITGETHYVRGRPYRLSVVERRGPPTVRLGSRLEIVLRPGHTQRQRESLLQAWYRRQLTSEVDKLVRRWAPRLGVHVNEVRIKRMRTRWGTCTQAAKRIWINSELAKKAPRCLEYIVVHELVHLIHKRHDESFVAIMDRELPRWRAARLLLNQQPLAHEKWGY